MKWITTIAKRFLPKEIPMPVGRWRIEQCNTKMNQKIDLSNEDHCGPCGQYALEQSNNLQKFTFCKDKTPNVVSTGIPELPKDNVAK